MQAPLGSPAPNLLRPCHCQLLHKAATQIFSADGQVLNTVHGVVGVPREVIELTLQECPVHADRRPRQEAAKPRLVPIVVNRAFWQCQVCSVQQGQLCAMRATSDCCAALCFVPAWYSGSSFKWPPWHPCTSVICSWI